MFREWNTNQMFYRKLFIFLLTEVNYSGGVVHIHGWFTKFSTSKGRVDIYAFKLIYLITILNVPAFTRTNSIWK